MLFSQARPQQTEKTFLLWNELCAPEHCCVETQTVETGLETSYHLKSYYDTVWCCKVLCPLLYFLSKLLFLRDFDYYVITIMMLNP